MKAKLERANFSKVQSGKITVSVLTTFVNVRLEDLGMKKIEYGLTEHMGTVEICLHLILSDKLTLFHSGGKLSPPY